jgi:hypothetical protein
MFLRRALVAHAAQFPAHDVAPEKKNPAAARAPGAKVQPVEIPSTSDQKCPDETFRDRQVYKQVS